jgi:uncharacterized damage-inducible protein DinB
MKALLQPLATYNLWANQQLADTLLSQPSTLHVSAVSSSFPSLLKTVLHLWDAEAIWWQRLRLSEKLVIPSAEFSGALPEACAGLLAQSRQWQEWVGAAQEHMLLHEFSYQNTKREKFKQPVHQVLLHVFNHGTYHRGQLITMLRQLGVEKLPQTDYIAWSRRRSA